MRVCECIACTGFPCADVEPARYRLPDVDVDPEKVRLALVSEAAPTDPADGYYAGSDALFARTTLHAFAAAGAGATSIQEILDLGVYLTTAVKCGKRAYGIPTATVRECSRLLEQELALFPNLQVILLMGDVAIQALNAIAKRNGEPRVIPAGSTYKIRGGEFQWRGRRVFPSYLQAGPAYFIEASKRAMIAQDLAQALALLR